MAYTAPLLLLVLTIAAFFLAGRGRYTGFGSAQVLVRILVALPLLFSGVVLHFFRTSVVAEIIPPAFPARYTLAILTGILEIAGAIGLFITGQRRNAALWLSIMMVAIFPANIFAANQTIGGLHMPSIPVRTTMQIVYIVLILLAGYGIPGRTKRTIP
jgi:uncharacterized membrane protein